MPIEQFAGPAQTTLAAPGIAMGGPSLIVTNPANFSSVPQFWIRVEKTDQSNTEFMLVTAVAGSTFTVTKGQNQTSDVAHIAGEIVTQVILPGTFTGGLVRQIILASPSGTAFAISPAGGQGIVTLTPPASQLVGTLGYAQVTADQGSFTAQTDLTGLTVTVTPGTGRRIRIRGLAAFAGTVANDQAALFIMEGATQVAKAIGAANPAQPLQNTVIAEAVLTPAATAHTYKLAGAREFGTGNITMKASATQIAFILVEDIGT